MIRNVLIMANSGLVLFSKEFSNSIAQPRMIGSLITAIIEFGQQTTGMSVSFIELTHVSIAIVSNEPVKIFCALFFDRQDGKLFGKLMASEILNAFIKDYSADFAQFGRNLKDFKGFHRKMLTVIYYSVRPVISWLELTAGIHKAIIVSDLEVIHSQKEELNDLGIISNLSQLIEMANELSNNFFISFILKYFCKFFFSNTSKRFFPKFNSRFRRQG